MTQAPAERDPRIDPIAGDVLIIGPQWQLERYQVMRGDGNSVSYVLGDSRFGLTCSLRKWRSIAATAEIVKRGEAAAECAGEKQ